MDDLIARIGRLLGQTVHACTPAAGGYTPATRLRCHTATGTVFAKAGATPLTTGWLRREIQVYQRVRGPFLPHLIAWEDHETEPVLILEDLSAQQWPPPWDEARVAAVLAQMDVMHRTPAPLLEPFAEVHGHLEPGWPAVAAEPQPFLSLGLATPGWLEAALPDLLEYERRCETAGDALTHWDLRSDNLCFTARGPLFIDWNLACRSNRFLDLGFWLPSLASEGGPEPERILPDRPEVAAFVSGFFAARAGLPQIPNAPRIRQVQRQQLETALPWVARALGLPPPIRVAG